MSFKENLPDYKSYNNGKVYMNVVPSGAWSEFSGLILKAASSDSDFVLILNHFAEIIPCEPAKTWSGSFLGEESQEFVRRIKSKVDKGHFDIFMDCLAVLNTIGQLSKDDVNEFLEDNEIGYRMEMDLFTRKPIWTLKDDATTSVENINEAQNSVIGVSQQAYEEFEMAKKSLQSASDERARKDAVRSCVSAMEAIVKEYGEDNEIGNATKNLKNSGSWGKEEIVKDGHSIFNRMHQLYPDLRHGAQNCQASSMTLEEAEYWIDRISCFMKYMCRMADKNGVK